MLKSHRTRLQLVAAACLVASLAACGGSDDDTAAASPTPSSPVAPTPPETFAVTLTGDQEAPTVITSAGIGQATLTLDRATRTISATMTVDGFTPTVAHIHAASAGNAGPVLFPMTISGNTATLAPTVLTTDQLATLDAGGLYFNAHSAANPAGELRGQIGREVFFAHMTGSQETNATTSQASGDARLVFDPKTSTVEGSMTLQGIVATLAHVHTGPFGTNGAVLIPMTDQGDHVHFAIPANTTLAASDADNLHAGGLYFNAHSTAFPGGELRGQIGRHILLATASGANETPPNASTATGHGFVVYDAATRNVEGTFHVDGMTATLAHIHQGPAGTAGPVIVPLMEMAAGTNTSDWQVMTPTTLTFDQANALLTDGTYYNAHSAAFASGEVRGQLHAAAPAASAASASTPY